MSLPLSRLEPLARPMTIDEFLAWEREQEGVWEFDGVQPVAMVGGTFAHALVVDRLTVLLRERVRPPCVPFGGNIKVPTLGGKRARVPDAFVQCSPFERGGDLATPTVVFEVLSESTRAADRGPKAMEYQGVESVQAIVLLAQDEPEATVLRRSAGWAEEVLRGRDAVLALPEIGIEVPLAALYD
jgi:Uma2 family endonuclease